MWAARSGRRPRDEGATLTAANCGACARLWRGSSARARLWRRQSGDPQGPLYPNAAPSHWRRAHRCRVAGVAHRWVIRRMWPWRCGRRGRHGRGSWRRHSFPAFGHPRRIARSVGAFNGHRAVRLLDFRDLHIPSALPAAARSAHRLAVGAGARQRGLGEVVKGVPASEHRVEEACRLAHAEPRGQELAAFIERRARSKLPGSWPRRSGRLRRRLEERMAWTFTGRATPPLEVSGRANN
mmetsp:Transcript_63377/g.182427  ORF Transcript_63377/g.182427 Transcript_63377/m.182427 type:complete len:239 (-) Transcript_63377:314-1030(-)